MKISQARAAFSAVHQKEQFDTEIKGRQWKQSRQTPQSQRPGNGRRLSRLRTDRVSISRQEILTFQSNYFASVDARSSVTGPALEESRVFGQKQIIEKLVGGIIDRKAAVTKIERNEDMQMEGDEMSTPDARDMEADPRFSRPRSVTASQLALTRTRIHFEEESARFSSRGQVVTEDGRVIDFSLDMSLDRAYLSKTQEQTLIHRWQEEINLTDPLVISLDGRAPTLSDAIFEFDLDNDGKSEQIKFAGRGSGFLAFDKNADGVINNGSELFGPGTGNGFNELAAYDEDQNRWIDENDAVFSQLSVWTKGPDGKDKLVSLKEAGIGAIALDHAETLFNMTDTHNQLDGQLKQSGVFLFENGRVGSLHQVDLASHTTADTIPSRPEPPGMKSVEPLETKLPPAAPTFDAFGANAVYEPAATPLQELLDRIKELREKLTKMMEKIPSKSGIKSTQKYRQNSYLGLGSTDPSILASKQRGGPAPARRWYYL